MRFAFQHLRHWDATLAHDLGDVFFFVNPPLGKEKGRGLLLRLPYNFSALVADCLGIVLRCLTLLSFQYRTARSDVYLDLLRLGFSAFAQLDLEHAIAVIGGHVLGVYRVRQGK